MKHLIIIGFFLALWMNPGFSQTKLRLKIDTTLSRFSVIGKQPAFSLKDTGEIRQRFKAPFKYENRQSYDLAQNGFRPGQRKNVMISRWDNMPVYNPPGHFPILSYRPDSATKYSMPILRIK